MGGAQRPDEPQCLTLQLGGCVVVGDAGESLLYSWVDRGLCDVPDFQIGQRMLDIIGSSARYAQAMEAAARQRQQSYDNG